MKPPSGSPGRRKGGDSAHAEPQKSAQPLSGLSNAGGLGRQDPAKKYSALRSYRFQRAKAPGIIEVLNENSYVMAEYSERTGSLKWQRMVLASQKEQIEKWLENHFPRS